MKKSSQWFVSPSFFALLMSMLFLVGALYWRTQTKDLRRETDKLLDEAKEYDNSLTKLEKTYTTFLSSFQEYVKQLQQEAADHKLFMGHLKDQSEKAKKMHEDLRRSIDQLEEINKRQRNRHSR